MPTVRVFATAAAPAGALSRIHRLLVDAFEGDFSSQDWEHTLGGVHVVVADGDAFISHAAVVPRRIQVGQRRFAAGYVEGVASAVDRQGQGLGSRAMAEASEVIRSRFELGVLSTSLHRF